MNKAEPDREEILDTLEMIYAWHTLPGSMYFKRYGVDMTFYYKILGKVRSTLQRAARHLQRSDHIQV